MMPNSTTPTNDLSNTYKGTNFSDVVVTQTGWVNMSVSVLDDVEEGQAVGTVYNSCGDVIENLTSAVTGRVLTVQVDPAVEQGTGVLGIVYNATESGGSGGGRKMMRRAGDRKMWW